MIRPRFYSWLIFLITVWLGIHFGSWNWGNLVLLFLILAPILSLLYTLILRARIRLKTIGDRSFIERGEWARWRYRLEMPHSLQNFYIRTESEVKDGWKRDKEILLSGGRQFEMAVELPGKHTGMVQPRSVIIRILDPFAFFSVKLGQLNKEEFLPVAVLPKSLSLSNEKDASKRVLESGENISQKSETLTDEIDRMRPMVEGDRIRSIHWKLSARMQKWMVRQYEKADESQLNFLLELPDPYYSEEDEERTLSLRDAVLDNVSANAQGFLSNQFSILLHARKPWKDELLVSRLDEYDLLRIRLAELPFSPTVDLKEQLREEAQGHANRFYCCFTYRLDQELVEEILLLALRAQGIMLIVVSSRPRIPSHWKDLIYQLAQHGVKVNLSRMPRRNA